MDCGRTGFAESRLESVNQRIFNGGFARRFQSARKPFMLVVDDQNMIEAGKLRKHDRLGFRRQIRCTCAQARNAAEPGKSGQKRLEHRRAIVRLIAAMNINDAGSGRIDRFKQCRNARRQPAVVRAILRPDKGHCACTVIKAAMPTIDIDGVKSLNSFGPRDDGSRYSSTGADGDRQTAFRASFFNKVLHDVPRRTALRHFAGVAWTRLPYIRWRARPGTPLPAMDAQPLLRRGLLR